MILNIIPQNLPNLRMFHENTFDSILSSVFDRLLINLWQSVKFEKELSS